MYRSSLPGVFLGKCVLKIYSKFTGEHPCRSPISVKNTCQSAILKLHFDIEIALRRRCSPINLLHIFRTPFPKNTSGRLLLMAIWSELKSQFLTVNFFKIHILMILLTRNWKDNIYQTSQMINKVNFTSLFTRLKKKIVVYYNLKFR